MALQNVEANITLDLYNHDTTPATVKAIQLDSETRYVAARLQNVGVQYDVDSEATVQLIVVRPDKVGVQITGTTFTYGDESSEYLGPYAELTQVALAVDGKMRGQFKITSGNQILRTEIFTISNGEALDASTDEWADEYDGYNLEEMATSIETNTADIATLEADVSQIKEDFSEMTTATAEDVGKALKAKTVTDGKVREWEFGDAGSSVELDATLTDSTKASPANAVGIIANLAEETSHEYATLTWENGGIKSADGSETASDTTIRTTYISMQSGDTLAYNRSSGAIGKINSTTYVYKYVNGTYKTFASLGNGSIYTADEACEIRFSVGIVSNAGITQDQAKVLATESVSVYRTITKTFPIVQKVAELEAYLPNIDAQIENAISFLKDGAIALNPSFTKKYYYNSTLDETSYNSDYFVIAKVDISEYIGLDMQLTCYASGSAYCGFTDADDTIISVWHQSSLETRTIPFNAKYLYISHSTNRVTFALNIVTISAITDIATLKNINDVNEYDASANYAIGDICTYNHTLYHCITATTGTFNSDCWESSGIVEELLNRDYVHPITKLTGLSWDARGDSITAGSNGPSYVPYVANLLGIAQTDYANSGVGGAKISGAYNGASTSKNIVTLFAGTNDFGLTSGASTLESFEANLRTIINSFRTNNQTARLYIITPIPRFDKETNEYDLTLLDYVDKMCEVCGELNTPCLNLYERCGINVQNYSKYLRTAQGDSLHPNLYGAVKIAIEIAKFVSEMEAVHRVVAFRS